MKIGVWKLAAAALVALALAGCGRNETAQEPPAAALNWSDVVVVQKMRSAALQTEGNALTLTRTPDADGPVGVSIERAGGAESAVLLKFATYGEQIRIRVRLNGELAYVDRERENAIMIGPGGASELLVYTNEGDTFRLRMAGVVDCASAPAGTCAPPQVRAD